MKHINAIDNKYNCSGCSACVHSCPKKCITMITDDEGFKYPLINEDVCIGCGICFKICPWQKGDISDTINKRLEKPLVFAIKNNNQVRLHSTSGGAFTAISDYILSNKGFVCGATFNPENEEVEHILSNSVKGRNKMRGSKYVQSNLNDSFVKIRELLENDSYVLFSGTPCQAAGLASFLGKDYPKLIIIDILCHSTPSPRVFKDIINREDKTVKNIVFRDKSCGWRNSYKLTLIKDNGNVTNSTYLNLFFKGLINRPSCYNCKFTNTVRPSDITIGDYWNIKNVNPSFEDTLGVSCVLINTEKGLDVFNHIKNSLSCIQTELKPAIQFCMSRPVSEPKLRKKYWYDYNKFGINYIENKYGHYDLIDNLKSNIVAPIVRKLGLSNIIRKILN